MRSVGCQWASFPNRVHSIQVMNSWSREQTMRQEGVMSYTIDFLTHQVLCRNVLRTNAFMYRVFRAFLWVAKLGQIRIMLGNCAVCKNWSMAVPMVPFCFVTCHGPFGLSKVIHEQDLPGFSHWRPLGVQLLWLRCLVIEARQNFRMCSELFASWKRRERSL